MINLFEYLSEIKYQEAIIKEVSQITAEDMMVNESFKSSLLKRLAKKIYDYEKDDNKEAIDRAKSREKTLGSTEKDEHGHYKGTVSFASIFGPVNTIHHTEHHAAQFVKWSEITDDDFKEYIPNDKELNKLLKKTYNNDTEHADFIVTKGNEIVLFITAYGYGNIFNFMPSGKWPGTEYTHNSGVREILTKYYSGSRKLKVNEVIQTLKDINVDNDVKVYALEITQDMLQEYETKLDNRAESKKGVINYDEESLKQLRNEQVARYRALAKQMRTKKDETKNLTDLWDHIQSANDMVGKLYIKIMSNPEYIHMRFDVSKLMTYVNWAYEGFYKSIQYKQDAKISKENAKKRAERLGQEFDDEEFDKNNSSYNQSIISINNAKGFADKVKKAVKEIEEQL